MDYFLLEFVTKIIFLFHLYSDDRGYAAGNVVRPPLASEEEWPNLSEEIALRKVLTSYKVTGLRKLGTLAYKIKCKREKQLKKITEVERNIRTSLFL